MTKQYINIKNDSSPKKPMAPEKIFLIGTVLLIVVLCAFIISQVAVPFLQAADRCPKQTAVPAADLSGCNFNGRDFHGLDLSGANFEGSNLIGADFRNANLTNANFKNANLQDADLTGAVIDLAIMDRVNPNLLRGITGEMVQKTGSWAISEKNWGDDMENIYTPVCHNQPAQWAPNFDGAEKHSAVAIVLGEDAPDSWTYFYELPIESLDVRFIDTVACVEVINKSVGNCNYSGGKARVRLQNTVEVLLRAVTTGKTISHNTFSGSMPDVCPATASDMTSNPKGSDVSKDIVTEWIMRNLQISE
jgi:hypothetical protein